MSMLLGVRGSTRENEGQPIREGIIQQPASFYNGNPSSSIWGNPPTPPLWRESSNANASSSSSSTSLASASSFLSTPTTSTRSAGMEQQPQERQWQYHVSKSQGKQTFDEDGNDEEDEEAIVRRRATEYGSSQDRGQLFMNEVEPSVSNPVISPFSFGFPPQSTFSVFGQGCANAFDPSHVPTDSSVEEHEVDNGASGKLLEGDERGFTGGFAKPNADLKNQKSSSFRTPVLPEQGSSQNFGMPYTVENLTKDNESQLQLQNEQSSTLCPPTATQPTSPFTFPSVSLTQERVSPEGVWQQALKSSGTRTEVLSSAAAQCTPETSEGASGSDASVTLNESEPSFGQKGQKVFVFGASGVSDTGVRTGGSQPTFVTSSVSGAGSRSRNAKLKKHSNSIKGKGLLGFGIGQIGSKIRDLSLSSADPGSPTANSLADNAECSGCLDTGIRLVDNPELESGRSESSQPPLPLKSEVNFEFGADRLNVQPTQRGVRRSGTFGDELQSTNELRQGVMKSEKKENPHVDQSPSMNQCFHDWHPFPKTTDEVSERVNERAQAQFLKSEKKENLHSSQMPNMSECLDGLPPFSRNTDEVSIEGKEQRRAQFCHPLNKETLMHGEFVDDMLSEENIANVIAGIANWQGLGNQGKNVSAVGADARVGKWMTGSDRASNTAARQLPNQGEAGVKELKSSDRWKFLPNSSVKPLGEEQVKEEPKYQALLEEFPKLGTFDTSLSAQKENQEQVPNIGSNKAEEPFVFRASRSISKPASSERAGQVNEGVKIGAGNGFGIPLPSISAKDERMKADSAKKTEECPTGGLEERLAHNYLQRSLNGGWSASTSVSSFNGRENIALGFDNVVQKKPSGTLFQPSRFPSGSFVGMPIAGISSFDAVQQSSSGEVCGTTPVGEFSGPVSSSESSASEGSPTRDYQWTGADTSLNQSHSFEFRGSNKEMRANAGTRKKKAQRVFPNLRRHSKQPLSKVQRNPTAQSGGYTTFSKPTDEEGSPMDFSPCFVMDPEAEVPLGSASNDANLEQLSYLGVYSPHSVDIEGDCREGGWENLTEDPRIEELRAAAAKIAIGNEHWDDISKADHQEFNGLFGQRNKCTGADTSCKRRSAFEEEQNTATGLETPWINSQVKRETEIEADLYSHSILNGEGSSQRKGFTFASHSPPTVSSSMLRRHTRRIQRERAAGIVVEPVKQPVSNRDIDSNSATAGTVASGRPGLDFVSEGTTAGSEGLSHGTLGTTDAKGESRASKTALGVRSNQSLAYDNDAERKAFTKKADSESYFPGQQVDPGMSPSPNAVKSAAAEQVCERWRLRGNQAYANGDFPKAEEYYSRGASSVSPNETSQSCIRASMLCYSNRAATRMAVGRMREALADCMRAIVVDPNFLRVRLRAASCHLALGESKLAANMFKECLKHSKESNKPDSKIAAEAMEGVKKTQQLDDYSDRLERLEKGNSTDSTAALRLLNEALLTSPYSESLLEMKAEALFSLRRHEEVVQLCEQSLPPAERNHGGVVNDQQHQDSYFGEPAVGSGNFFLKLWRWRMSAKSLYHLGRLEESLTLLLKHDEALSTIPSDKATSMDSLAPAVSVIRDLLRHKAAGNEAFQAGKHAEAVEHYTAALACNGESRPYNAVCSCNRAAASQALGNIAEAIADCSRAIALDSNYPKAISRRATLHEMVRDYGQVCNDLRRLIALLESYQQHGKNNLSGRVGVPNSNSQDLRQARDRLAKAEEELKKGHPVDHYMILGVDFSWSANEIKKAYRKAALKHHPDKAGQFLARGENGDDGSVWKEVGDEVRRDAERLFKMIGEAYAVLSDPTKRLRYDTEEELRKLRVKNGTSSASSTSEAFRSQYEKGGRRQRDRWDPWNGYAPQYQRWQSGPDAAQPDTYARRNNYAASGNKSSGDGGRNTDFDWDEV